MSPRTQREAKDIEKFGLTRKYYRCQPPRQGAFKRIASNGEEFAIGCGHSFWTIEISEEAFDRISEAAMKYDEIAQATGGRSISGLPSLTEVYREKAASEQRRDAEKRARRKERSKAKQSQLQALADATGRSTGDERAEAEYADRMRPKQRQLVASRNGVKP